MDENGHVVAVNCYCFYLEDKGPVSNPTGALWCIMPRNHVPAGVQTALVKQ